MAERPAPSPHVVVIAGPNGAGKSTIAPLLLRDTLAVREFVNADVIARGLSAFDPERAALAAGRVMLARLQELAAARENFAFETTLASRSFAPWLERLRATGYAVHVYFLWLPTADMAVERVAERVRTGGHHVPGETVRRRYAAGVSNFFQLYMPLATRWAVFLNTDSSGPRTVAEGAGDATVNVLDPRIWDRIKRGIS